MLDASSTHVLDGYVERAELAKQFGRCERTIERWIDEPDGLPFVKVGNKKLFRLESVRCWLERRERSRNPRAA